MATVWRRYVPNANERLLRGATKLRGAAAKRPCRSALAVAGIAEPMFRRALRHGDQRSRVPGCSNRKHAYVNASAARATPSQIARFTSSQSKLASDKLFFCMAVVVRA